VESLQLTLFEPASGPELSPEELLERLRERLAGHLAGSALGTLTLTDNRSTLLSTRAARNGRVAVRLHWAFFDAPDRVLRAVARIVDGTDLRRSRATVREWVARSRSGEVDEVPEAIAEVVVPGRRRSRPKLSPEPGAHVHDLEAIRDEVNERYFEGRHPVAIGWSKAGRPHRRGRRRTIKLGSWSEDDRTVRIHPALDHPSVPRWVVESVVHHELLHADLDPVVSNGRRRLHTPEFRRREREFERHDDARRWIDRHLGALLRRRARLAR
jgi:hypothetical protein